MTIIIHAPSAHVICRFTTGGRTEIRSDPFRNALHVISQATGARSEDMGYTIQPALNRSTIVEFFRLPATKDEDADT